MESDLQLTVDLSRYPLDDEAFRQRCRVSLDDAGVLVLQDFLRPAAVTAIREEGEQRQPVAFYTTQRHNVFLTPPDPAFDPEHPRNRQVTSTKGCITDDQIATDSPLRTLYNDELFRGFLCEVLDEPAMHPYADPLSSINLHYAADGQELGWHFDNSAFAITLMIQEPEQGGAFEYVSHVRDADADEMNYDAVRRVLEGEVTPRQLAMPAGALVLFRGRNSMHRVVPVHGSRTRMLVVLAYNTKPGIALSESARTTFYGRLR